MPRSYVTGLLGSASGKPAIRTPFTVTGPVARWAAARSRCCLPCARGDRPGAAPDQHVCAVSQNVKLASVEVTVTSSFAAGVGLLTVDGSAVDDRRGDLDRGSELERIVGDVAQQPASRTGTTPVTTTNESAFGGGVKVMVVLSADRPDPRRDPRTAAIST